MHSNRNNTIDRVKKGRLTKYQLTSSSTDNKGVESFAHLAHPFTMVAKKLIKHWLKGVWGMESVLSFLLLNF